ncbi:MAG: GH3 auxin-responsive promoter family protein, partial [Verrucomicrobiota bacterium]
MNSLAAPSVGSLPVERQFTMLTPPKSLVTLGASFLTTRAASRLRKGAPDFRAQDKHFQALVAAQEKTAFGRENGLEKGLPYEKFQQRVPLRAYENFIPWIDRMKSGEADVLRPGRCQFYAVSSGTTAGRTKYLPITDGMLAHFRKAGLDSLLYYTSRVGHAGVFQGKHLFLGGATSLTPMAPGANGHQAYAGDLSGITALNLPEWLERHYYEPGADIAQMSDWPAKINAIVQRTLHADVSLLAGIPSWILILAEELLKAGTKGKNRPVNLQALWPNFECLIHGGVPVAPFADELRAICGPGVNFHEVYPASEGFIAAQDADSALGLRLMCDAGIHYEFLPMDQYHEDRLELLGPRTVPLSGVKAGVDYALVMTTPAGLCRYLIGDIVRFVSTDIPRLVYAGRTKLQLSAFGEHVIEKELTDALTTVCQRHKWKVVNFHVAPVFVNALAGARRGHHEWWVELKPLSMETPTGPVLAAELDAE